MDIWSFFRVLNRRKWLIITVTLTAVLATFFITLKLPQDYKSQATLATGITENSEVSLEENNTANPYVINTRFSNLIELINSRRIMSLLSYQLIIHDLESNEPFRSLEPLKEEYRENFLNEASVLYQNKLDSMETLGTSKQVDYALLDILKKMKYDEESIKEDLKIDRGVGSDFINITFVSEDPQLSAFVVNTLTQEFIRYYKTNKVRRVENSLQFFTNLVQKKKSELDEKVETLRSYKEEKNVINYGAQSANMLNRIAQLESNREEETKRIVGLKSAIRNIDNQVKGSAGNGYGEQAGNNNKKIFALRARMNELNDRYIAGGMSDKALGDSIGQLRNQMDALIRQSNEENLYQPNMTRQDLASLRVKNEIELETAQARLASIQSELARLQEQAYGFSTNEGDIASLESDIQVAREEYLQVLDKYNTARNASFSVANKLEQVEVGEPAYEPEDSKRIMLIAISGAASFSLCVVLIFFLEFVNMRIDSPSKFQSMVRLPLIGSLNKVNLNGFDLKALFANQNNDENREMYKQLLRKLRFEIEADKPKSLLVTSSKRGEGKTFTIISLAYSLSLLGKKVLIVDTNFKNNTLTKIFMGAKQVPKGYLEESNAIRNPNAEPRLLKEANVAEGAGAGGESYQRAEPEQEASAGSQKNSLISSTRLAGIDLIASKGGDFSPAEIFMSKNFRDLLKELEKEYDYIIMEGPAMNEYSDTKELVNFVDKVVTIFSAESSVDKMDRDTINFLKKLDGKFIGAILNKVEPYNLNY